jgi:uncharacterized protein (DUF1697 family)
MIRYIAFLRAVNVGGRMVKMDTLKTMLTMPGIRNISTYIQSGNVAFDCKETEKGKLTAKIESKLLKELGWEVKTLLRTKSELEAIINSNPYKKFPEDMALHVTFLSAAPDADLVKQLLALQTDAEQFVVIGTYAYIFVKKGTYGETKFSNTFVEKKLKVSATTRNWATVNKMLDL